MIVLLAFVWNLEFLIGGIIRNFSADNIGSAFEYFHGESEFTSLSKSWLTGNISVKALANLFAERQTYAISIRVQIFAFGIVSLEWGVEGMVYITLRHSNSFIGYRDFKHMLVF